MMNKSKHILLQLAQAGIDNVRGDYLVEQAARDCSFERAVDVAAIGKAAAAMAAGAHRVLGKQIQRTLVITKTGHIAPWSRDLSMAECLEAGHPIPTRESLLAGGRLVEWLDEADREVQLLLLISGGASSLVEAPVEGFELSDLQRINQWLLGSGLDIEKINQVRRQVSRIKGGNLLRYIGARKAEVWLLSDVAGDNPAVIGSGLCFPPQCSAMSNIEYPDWLAQLLSGLPAPQTAKITVPDHRVLGNLQTACAAIAKAARAKGLAATVHTTDLVDDAEATGRKLARQLQGLPEGVHVWGGETTVNLPLRPGRGGRNQHLALAAATVLAGKDDVSLLAIGTDGTDGPTEDAGALVNGGTIGRGELAGLDANDCLKQADSGRFLEASGDLISTGPTGTNVRDIVIAGKGLRQV
jgi:hydroxypyruvate reductase